MAKTIVLSLNHFEPYHVEVVQCSVGDTITFIFRDYAGSHDDPSLHLKSPSGIPEEIPCIATTGFIGAEFTPNADTFLELGRYTGTLEFGDTNDPDVIIYSFPIFFDVIRSASIAKWSKTVPQKKMGPGVYYTISTDGVTVPYGNKIIAKVGDGAAVVEDGDYVCMPDISTGPIKIEYDSTRSGEEIKITNLSNSEVYGLLFPQMTFEAYYEPMSGINPPDDVEFPGIRLRIILSSTVTGPASMSLGETFSTGEFSEEPDAPVMILCNSSIVKSGIPTNGDTITDTDGTQFMYNSFHKRVEITAGSLTGSRFNGSIKLRSFVFREE